VNGIGYAISEETDILNLSLNFDPPTDTTGNSPIDRMLDWAVEQGVNVTVAAGNIVAHRDGNGFIVLDENPPAPVRGPASSYNGVAVGRTGVPPGNPLGPVGTVLNYNQVFMTSASVRLTVQAVR
jgi:hypothetical protein